MMHLSPNGAAFLKDFEQCRLVAYRDVRGRWTNGWGHTGDDVADGVRWTQSFADSTFLQDVQWAEQAVNELVRVALTQGQFDALVSFVYNIGRPQFTTSTLLRRLNEGNYNAARLQFRRWNKATVNGMLVAEPGLTTRRAAEAAMFK